MAATADKMQSIGYDVEILRYFIYNINAYIKSKKRFLMQINLRVLYVHLFYHQYRLGYYRHDYAQCQAITSVRAIIYYHCSAQYNQILWPRTGSPLNLIII
jgi:hypothetical protein